MITKLHITLVCWIWFTTAPCFHSISFSFFFHEPPRPPDHYLVPDNLYQTNLNCVWGTCTASRTSALVASQMHLLGYFQDTVGHEMGVKVAGASRRRTLRGEGVGKPERSRAAGSSGSVSLWEWEGDRTALPLVPPLAPRGSPRSRTLASPQDMRGSCVSQAES